MSRPDGPMMGTLKHRRSPFGLVVVALVLVIGAGLVANVADPLRSRSGESHVRAVPFGKVQGILASSCSGCHPGVVASLDLTAPKSYTSIVGVQSTEAPSLPLIIAGDPDRSYLYLKIAGWPGNGPNPIVGGRMPFAQPPLPAADLATIRDWITGGARNADGKTVSAGQVATPGNVTALAQAKAPQAATGDASIAGTIYDVKHRPLPGAVVAMLVIRPDLPGGEEHYLAAVTGADGRYTIRSAPVGRVEIKAYGTGTVYVSHLLTTAAGQTTVADVGLPTEATETPTISAAKVQRQGDQLVLSMDVQGARLDRNYTLAVNPDSGRVFELRATPDGSEQPGPWSRTVPAAGLDGGWIFLAVSHNCNVSNMISVPAP